MKKNISLFLKGLIIGAVELIPGVSGGTMALLLGIYERLIDSISKADLIFFKSLLKGKFRFAWSHVDGNFLLLLVLGMISSVFILASLISYLLEFHPFFLKGFFTGLLLFSLFYKPLKPEHFNRRVFIGGGFSLIIFILLLGLPSYSLIHEINFFYVFFGGLLAVCAFILPGISGSFILLILGLYEGMITAFVKLDISFIFTLIMGCISGLLLFTRVLKKGFQNFRETLSGFFYFLVLFSVVLVWKKEAWTLYNAGLILENIKPLLGFFLGAMLIFVLKRMSVNAQDT